MKENNICCLLNFGPVYRQPIYLLMEQELNCDFYFGDRINTSNIQKLDYSQFKNFKGELKFHPLLGNFHWLTGTLKLIFKPYSVYIITGDAFCLSNWVLLIVSRVLGKKTYLWMHGWYGKERGIKKYLKKIFLMLGHTFFLYGEYAKNLLLKENFSEDKMKVIYNSLDYQKQLNVRRVLVKTNVYEQYFNNLNPVLIYIGRVQKVKRLDLILKSMYDLKKISIETNLVVVGQVTDDDEFETYIKSYDLQNNVWLHGPCYAEQEIGPLLYNATVCVSPGNIGLTAMHSLVYGTPIITHDNFSNQMPEFESIIPGVTGDFFKEGDSSSLTSVIKGYVKLSEEKREIIRHDCYKVIDEKYNPLEQIKLIKEAIFNS